MVRVYLNALEMTMGPCPPRFKDLVSSYPKEFQDVGNRTIDLYLY